MWAETKAQFDLCPVGVWVSTRPLSRMTPKPDVRTETQSASGARCSENICCSDQACSVSQCDVRTRKSLAAMS